MNKHGKKKLRLSAETIRQLSQEALSEAVGGFTEFCTRITRCVDSCPCQQTEGVSCWC